MFDSYVMAGKPPTAVEFFNAIAEGYEVTTGGCPRELAHKVLPLLQKNNPITSSSIILDNACGTGTATDIILNSTDASPTFHLVDGAENMVNLARARFESKPNVKASVAVGEDLSIFSDNHFSHSITNVGLLFFVDPAKGAAEIYRTLAPGGVAVVTGWEDLGYPPVLHRVQMAVRPEDKLFAMPLPPETFVPDHTRKILEGAGFSNVEMLEEWAHWAAVSDSWEGLSALLMKAFGPAIFNNWTEEEREKGREVFARILPNEAESFVNPDGEKAVGIKMKAIVAVCRK